MAEGTPPPTTFPEIAAMQAAYEGSIAAERRLGDMRVQIAQEAGRNDVKLARLDIALVLMAVVSAKVGIGKPSLEERQVAMIAQLISDRASDITRKELLEALDSFKDNPDASK